MDVAALKLMGPDGSVRTRVITEEVELCEADRGSAPPSLSFQHFSSFGSRKAGTSSINDLGSVSLDKIPEGSISKDGEDASEGFKSRNKRSHVSTSSPGVQQRKSLKVSRNSSSSLCSKRRAVELDDSLLLSGADEVKDSSDKIGSYLKKCSSHEKTQLLKQKSSLSSKRGDKRNLKVSLKTKFDSLFINAGNGSAAAGSSFYGLYGLKSEVHDFSKLTDDPPLNDLLDVSYDCASLIKDEGKIDTNVNECFLQSIRKACSVLQLPRPAVCPQNTVESESCSNSKPSTSLVNSVSCMEEGANFDVERPSATDAPSLSQVQDACSNSETTTNVLDFKLFKPDDMFVKLDLPPPKDLESLLQDAGKSSVFSKNATDLRSAKQQSRRAILQPFLWSHSFNGHSKANSDSSKFSANRTTCPGRWWRVANFSNVPSATADCLAKDLESLTFNQSLFPSTMRLGSDEGKLSVSVNRHLCGWDSLSPATCSKASSVLVESRGKMNHDANEQQCPRVMVAAQALYDIATQAASRQNIDGIVRWPKKASQKSMKTRKLKSEEPEELHTAPTTYGLWSNNSFKTDSHIHITKKPKPGTIERRRDITQPSSSISRKGPLNWATPRSNRTSPSKFFRDSVSEAKHSTTLGIMKQSSMMPPPATLSSKAGDGQQKTRKLMLMDWKRGGGGATERSRQLPCYCVKKNLTRQ